MLNNKLLQKDIAEFLGVSSQFINQVIKGKCKLPKNKLEALLQNDRGWDVSMLGGQRAKPEAVLSYDERGGVPYYAVDFLGGFDYVVNQQTATPDARIVFPQFNRAECWVDVSGHSMEPLISSGDLIALRRVQDWRNSILYGEVYAIVTSEYRTVKRIRRSTQPDHIRLVPENPEYDAQDVDTASILAVFAVVGCAKRIS